MKTLHKPSEPKSKTMVISVPNLKPRGHMPPAGFTFRPKTTYNRNAFKNSRNWN